MKNNIEKTPSQNLLGFKAKMVNRKNAMLASLLGATLIASTSASAAAIATTDDFFALYTMLDTWSSGGLGVGLALVGLLVGVITGVGRSTILPALIGLAFAAVVSLGPGIILSIITSGALI